MWSEFWLLVREFVRRQAEKIAHWNLDNPTSW
jgi:hypothetical protein